MTFTKKALIASSLSALVLGLAQPASAGIFVFTDRAAFNAAAGSVNDHDFNGIFIPGGMYVFGSQTVDGVTFDSNALGFTIGTNYFSGYGKQFFSGQTSNDNDPANEIDVALGSLRGFGFTFGSYPGVAEEYLVSFNVPGGSSFVTSANPGETGFIGFLSDSDALTNARIVSQGGPGFPNGIALDIVDFATVDLNRISGPVPESSTWMLMIAGFGIVAAALRRAGHRTVRSAKVALSAVD